jgi:FixJ family two-component response regulator
VDDEEKSLKYFRKAYKNDFHVITAPSANEGWEALVNADVEVGIVVSDQRMPGKTGVELLSRVREEYPRIVRILTTAYSDMDAAIEAVNSGSIFHYVVKPWNIRDLRGILLRAMEFYLVARERDTLLREKMSVLQRMMVVDRVRCLAAMSAGLAHHIRNSMSALVTFLDLAPEKLSEEVPDPSRMKNPSFWQDHWALAHQESERLMDIIQDVVNRTAEPAYCFQNTATVRELLQPALQSARESEGCEVEVDISPEVSELKVDEPKVENMFQTLLERTIRMRDAQDRFSITVRPARTTGGSPGVGVKIAGGGPAWSDDMIASLFTVFAPAPDDPRDLGLDLLSAYFIAYHHGGDISVLKEPPEDPGFEVVLPLDPESAERPSLEKDFMEKVLSHYDMWGAHDGPY